MSANTQRLSPLFAVALALMAVGFYMAFSDDATDALDGAASIDLSESGSLDIPEAAIDRDVQAVELGYRAGDPRQVRVSLRQTSRHAQAEDQPSILMTSVDLGLREEISDADQTRFEREGVVAITRTYERASAEVSAVDGQLVGAGITSQVEDLLRGSVTRMFVAANGEPLDFEWREVPNPQARRMLYLVRDAQSFLTPRYFAGALNPGDTWTYKRPLRVEEPQAGVSATGEVVIDNEFAGVLEHGKRRLAVVRQTLSANVEGAHEQEDGAVAFTLEGQGTGTALVDVGAGHLYAANVDFRRDLSVGEDAGKVTHTSDISLRLRPNKGSALPELRQEEHQDGHELEASKDHTETQ